MLLRRSILSLLIFLISLSVSAEVPTRQQVEQLWESNPEAVVEMIQKLYVLENATPDVELPDLQMFDLNDGETLVRFDGVMGLTIGTPAFNLMYDIMLEPKEVVIGYKEPPPEPVTWPWYVLVGTLSAVAGGVIGYGIAGLTGR